MTDRTHHLDAWRTTPHDAVIVGGGPAGLSAALLLGRARKRVVVVDNDRPANAVSQGVGGLLGHDRVKPADLRDSGRRQLEEHAERRVPAWRRRGRRAHPRRVRGQADRRAAGARPRDRAGPRAALRPAAAARDRGAVGAVGVPLRVLRRLGGARPATGVPRQRPGRRALGARARRLEQRRRAVHGRRARPGRRGAGRSRRARPHGADRPAGRNRWPPRPDRVRSTARPSRARRCS